MCFVFAHIFLSVLNFACRYLLGRAEFFVAYTHDHSGTYVLHNSSGYCSLSYDFGNS